MYLFYIQSLIEEKSNNTARKAGAMMLSCFNAQTLTVNEDLGVALVEITVNKGMTEVLFKCHRFPFCCLTLGLLVFVGLASF